MSQALTLDEKLALLDGVGFWESRAAPSIGLRSLFFSDGPHGLRRPRTGTSSGVGSSLPATCFPTASALAATWDEGLVAEIGAALGREARALHADVVLGPGMNAKRSPLCGRNFEYFSEDPLVSGKLAAAMVRGIQSVGVSACIKHFAVNDQEHHRMVIDAVVDERTLREHYLRGFEIAVTEGRPLAVMGAYNRVNGVYACEHVELLQGILRDDWGFDGIVVSDWGAVDDRVAAVKAGLDLAMPTTRGADRSVLRRAVRDGRLSEHDVDACIARLRAFARRIDEGCAAPAPHVDWDAHHALARRAAAASCVLLKNEDAALPLVPSTVASNRQRVALVGAFAKTPRFQGAGSSGVVPTRLVTVHDAMDRAFGASCTYSPGYRLDGNDDATLRADAVAAARNADVAVVVVGLPPAYESEAFDRDHMSLPSAHDALVGAIADVCQRVVVVLCNGAPVAMPWADRASAILEAYLGGQAAGDAIVDVLTGAVNPSAKLAETFPHALTDHASSAFFPGDGQHVEYREGLYVGYRWFDTADIEPRFPFGHGLSYTTFALADLRIEKAAGSAHDEIAYDVSVEIENTGARRGAEVVQIYVHDVEHAIARPEQELAAFQRIELAPGERARAIMRLDVRAFAFWDVRAGRWAVDPGVFEIRAGTSSRSLPLRERVEIAAPHGPFAADAPAPWIAPRAPFHPSDADFATLLGRPLPMPRPHRPFTRGSTLGQVRATPLGALLFAGARRESRAQLARGGDPALVRFADAMVTDLPLRAMVTLSAKLRWRQLDALVELLNGQVVRAARALMSRRARDE